MSALAEPRAEAAPAPASAALNLVDAENPWLGLDSFSEETRGFFHGREEEIGELARRVQRKLLAILFGQSGLGKTSILRAGIVPRLRREGYCPVYVRIDYSRESPSPSEQIKQAIFRATESSGKWSRPGSAIPGESLWEFLHHRDDLLRDAEGKTLTPLIIFDQFEEIFTLGQDDDFGRKRAAQFIEDLADLVENRPPKSIEAMLELEETIVERFDFSRADYRILIALREDYLAHLEGLKAQMPSITQNRMRLARMTGEQALVAVTKPGGRLVTEEVAEAIVRFIAGGAELRNAEVEPSLLSLVCRELNNARKAQGRAEISADLLAGSRDTILNEFYERALADQPAGVRRFVEDAMLTESGFRESLAEERVIKGFAAAGAAQGSLPALVNRRLLRIEERLDVRRVELTHDVLCAVVRTSRDQRHEREAREESERQLQAQREREAATHRALVRARQVAAGCSVLAVVAIAGALFGWQNMKRAQEAEARAEGTRGVAESARGEAEKLMVFLLDDFTRELEPTGRLDIVAELAKRALEYYRELPRELRTPATERNRALALVRYGWVLRGQNKYEAALPMLEEAEKTFRGLRAQGDQSEAAALGLAGALGSRSSILGGQLKLPESVALGAEALAILGPLAAAPNPSRAVFRQYGEMLVGQGFNTLRNDAPDVAVGHLQEAQKVFRKLGAPDTTDLAAAAAYAGAAGWLGTALRDLEKWRESKASLEEAIAVSGRVLDVMPGHTRALHTKGLSLGQLSELESQDHRLLRALALAREDEQTQADLLKIDPTSGSSMNNLGVARFLSSGILWRLGRLTESCGAMRAAVAAGTTTGRLSSFSARNLAFWSTIVAECSAELGDPAGAAAALEHSHRLLEKEIKPTSSAFQAAFAQQWQANSGAWILLAQGDAAGASRRARDALDAVDALAPPNKGTTQFKQRLRLRTHLVIARAERELGNHPTAERAARAALEAWQSLPRRDFLGTELQGAVIRAVLAESIARQGRQREAADVLAPALKFHREHFARHREDREQQFEFAHALLVASLVDAGARASVLGEANALLEGLPASMGKWIYMARLRSQIAGEAKALR